MEMNVFSRRLSDSQFEKLADLIEERFGLKITESKKEMLEARLRKRLKDLGMPDFKQYIQYLFSVVGMKQEMPLFADVVTTHKTDFFREPEHFDYLTRFALPGLISQEGAGVRRPLMVWSAGCSTGEEPYTLAMVLNELQSQVPGFSLDFTILGTDLSEEVVAFARRAVYAEERIAPVPMELRKRYLLRSKDKQCRQVRIVPVLRQKVKFRALNFMNDQFGVREMMDIIFCRNVLIYFNADNQRLIISRLLNHLRPGGYIFFGHSESLHQFSDLALEMVYHTTYRKI